MKSIAIVGAIGSGKSTVLSIFENINIPGLVIETIDLDSVSKYLKTTNKQLRYELEQNFGSNILCDGEQTVAEYVLDNIFPYDGPYNLLNSIMEPYLLEYITTRQRIRNTTLLVVEGAALINSNKLLSLFEHIIEVYSDESVCKERVHSRGKGYNDAQVDVLYKRSKIYPGGNYREVKPAYSVATHPINNSINTELQLHYDVEKIVYTVLTGERVPSNINEFLYIYYGVTAPAVTMPSWAYHNINHVTSTVINTILLYTYKYHRLVHDHGMMCSVIACLFHDYISDQKPNAERRSADYMMGALTGLIDDDIIEKAYNIILCTQYSLYDASLPVTVHNHVMTTADLMVFQYSREAVLDYERAIRREYIHLYNSTYNEHRKNFLLEKLVPILNHHFQHDIEARDVAVLNVANILDYIDGNLVNDSELLVLNQLDIGEVPTPYIKTTTERIAIYPGSFNPLHVGHLDIINTALKIFDKVIVVRCINGAKSDTDDLFVSGTDLPERAVIYRHTGSFTSFLDMYYLDYNVTIIRGIRNNADLQYEMDYITYLTAVYDKELPPVVFIPANKDTQHVSSSSIKAILPFHDEYANSLIVK
jgi:pantetheine-phosphate adenylyltransferase